jgi:CheY-like chemotaxis protein
VEDNRSDVKLVQEALRLQKIHVRLHVAEDGEKAIQWMLGLDAQGKELPSAVVLDLNLPKRHGAEVLSFIRSSPALAPIPVIIFTSSNSQVDRALAERHPKTSFLRKSSDFDEFMGIGSELRKVLNERN